MNQNTFGFWGYFLIAILLILLSYAGYLSYKSIDWTVLQRLESQGLVLPTPIPASSSALIITPTTSSQSATTKP